jgi:hypothetical protein
MIVGLVMDQDGRPLCCELWPGNTADVTTLLPVVMTRSLYPPFSSLCKHYKLIFVIDTTWARWGFVDRRGGCASLALLQFWFARFRIRRRMDSASAKASFESLVHRRR